MKLRIDPQWHFLALLAVGVVTFLRGPAVLERAAWSGGSGTVTGRVDSVEAGRRVRVVRYTYEVDGKAYGAETTSSDLGVAGVPTVVTYAKSDPAVSTLNPEKLDGIFRTSLIVLIVACLPLLIMWGVEIRHLFARKQEPVRKAHDLPQQPDEPTLDQ